MLLLCFSINPSEELHGNELPRVDGFLAQKSRQPWIVKLGELREVATLVGHDPRVDVLDDSLGIRHPKNLLPICLKGF